MAGISIIGVSGSVTRPSRTTALVQAVLDRIEARSGIATRLIELVDSAPRLFGALTRDKLVGDARALVQAIEQADLLVIGTPVYRASYTGALKHLFDLVHHAGFASKPIILTATGGSHLHGLVTEHQLRPLFGFLNALTLPTTVYAVETDFLDYRVSSSKILDRVERAVTEALTQLGRQGAESAEQEDRRALAAG
ncbi:FMN reductase [Methylocapsa sp. S129]|uniref:FMN reductase n=1 Tax=Methylocapsa sp. S129 TaxID=1641869 RepID=UPI00131BEB36|nr:FMN reductase [Methylocapsa sp. S129]